MSIYCYMGIGWLCEYLRVSIGNIVVTMEGLEKYIKGVAYWILDNIKQSTRGMKEAPYDLIIESESI